MEQFKSPIWYPGISVAEALWLTRYQKPVMSCEDMEKILRRKFHQSLSRAKERLVLVGNSHDRSIYLCDRDTGSVWAIRRP